MIPSCSALIRPAQATNCRREEPTYHITDLSKGAMRVTDASSSLALRYERYKRWYPLLCEEIKLVARPNAPIIPVGHVVRDFLTVQKMLDLKDEILH